MAAIIQRPVCAPRDQAVPAPGRRAQLRTVRAFATAVLGRGERATCAAGRRVTGGCPAARPTAYDPFERESEVFTEQRIDHRVDGAVAVAQPEHDRKQRGLYARGTERSDQVHGEERQPAYDEAADDYAQRLGRLCLHAEPLNLRLDVPLAATHHLRAELRLVHGPGPAAAIFGRTTTAAAADDAAAAAARRIVVRR